MKKLLSIICVSALLLSMITSNYVSAQSVTINGFTTFEMGGYQNGSYYPITAEAVGTDSIKYTGQGGYSWPDSSNNPEADAVGGIYNTPVVLDGLKFNFAEGTNLGSNGLWYAISFANTPRLFDLWNGALSADCGIIRLNYDNGVMGIMINRHTTSNTWQDLGGCSIPYTIGDSVNFELKKVTGGFELYARGSKLNFSFGSVIAWDSVLPNSTAYFMTSAYVGNSGSDYAGTYSYTVGIDKSVPIVSNFVPFEKGGYLDGAYYPITTEIFGSDSIKYTGKGGFSWEDATNNPEADSMGGMYNKAVNLDEFKFDYTIGTDLGDQNNRWYVISFASSPRLLDLWHGDKTADCGFLRLNVQYGNLNIMPNRHTTSNTWQPLGGTSIPYSTGNIVSFELKKVTGGYELFANGNKLTFGDGVGTFTTIEWDSVLPSGTGYFMTAANIGNPGSMYSGTYNYTVSVKETIKINNFKPYEKGGYLDGTYYPIAAEAVGTSAIKYTGKGGFSWPDADNNPEADSMGGIYNSVVNFDGFKFNFAMDTNLQDAGGRWYVLSFANSQRLLDLWHGDKTANCGFLRLNYDNGVMGIMPNKHTTSSTWQPLGGASIPYILGHTVYFELKKVTGGYELYANKNLITFGDGVGTFTTIAWDDVLPTGTGYFMSGVHVGNPGSAYTSLVSYSVGIGSAISFGSLAVSASNVVTGVTPGSTVNTFATNITLNNANIVTKNIKSFNGTIISGTDKVGTGSSVEVLINDVLTNTYKVVIYGDLNGDGDIALADMTAMKQHIIKIQTLDGENFSAGDINKNSTIGVSDLLAIKKHLLNIGNISQS